MNKRVQSLLVDAGFNQLEATAYVALLKESGSTGYRISQIIGKPAANTYKALDSLVRKGAALVDGSGRGRVYMGVPVGEYLEGMKQNIEAKRQALEKELADLGGATIEQGLYRLTNAEQVYTRVRKMLHEARSVMLFDIWPAPLENLRPDLERAAKRGVKILVKTYAPVEVAGCEVFAPEKEAEQIRVWKGDWLIVVADCQEFVVSLLEKSGPGVLEALWSSNDYLALLTHNWVLQELTLTRLGRLVWQKANRDDIVKEANRLARRYMIETPMHKVAAPWAVLRKEAPAEACESDSAGEPRSRKED